MKSALHIVKHSGDSATRASDRTPASTHGKDGDSFLTVELRMAEGKALREKAPRSSQGNWVAPLKRADPIQVLMHLDRDKLPDLLPIRYARMRESPFGFFRGAAGIMAADLAGTTVTGIRVQGCGDCHVANFGGFGSPERELIFDITDFDETLPAPWEWDVKRLTTSIVLAARDSGLSEQHSVGTAQAAVAAYCGHMRRYAQMQALKVWYSHLDAQRLVHEAADETARERWKSVIKKAKKKTPSHDFPKMATSEGRSSRFSPRIVDDPPHIFHARTKRVGEHAREMFEHYRATLPDERRVVLDRYQIVDVARMAVGIGSVGTRCAVVLLMAGPDDALFLQFKQAEASVFETYAGKSRYSNHGERVVTGQRMLQSGSDIFLGWTRDGEGRDYYFRQLHDMKMSVDVEEMSKQDQFEYAELCGWALARAHARTGDPARIAGYIGKNDAFSGAIAKFAAAYADQTERDHAELVKAIRAGKLVANAKGAI
jgi:uncharacterized protein (DUF2252 family)